MSMKLVLFLVLWHAQWADRLGASVVDSGVGSSQHASSQSGQTQSNDQESRLKRITEAIHRIPGPDVERGGQDERLVLAGKPPSEQNNQFMTRNEDLFGSGDGAADDEEAGDEDGDGDFGSGGGHREEGLEPEGGVPEYPFPGGRPAPTEGVYPADLDERKEKPDTKQPPKSGVVFSGTPRKSYETSDQRHGSPKAKPKPSSSWSHHHSSPSPLFSLRLLCVLLIGALVLINRTS